jgi:hypothetical protein
MISFKKAKNTSHRWTTKSDQKKNGNPSTANCQYLWEGNKNNVNIDKIKLHKQKDDASERWEGG